MVFYHENFTFDGIKNTEMGVILVTTGETEVLSEFGIHKISEVTSETMFGRNPFYKEDRQVPERITLEFCLIDEFRQAMVWEEETEEKILNWLIKDDFCEFVTEDYPDVCYYLRATKITHKRNYERKGVIEIEFQPYCGKAYKKIEKKNLSCKGTNKDFSIELKTSNKKLYPLLTVRVEKDGDISFENKTVNKKLELIGLKKGDVIHIDNDMYVVEKENGDNLFHKCNREWIYFVNGQNDFKASGDFSFDLLIMNEINI